MRPRTTTPFTKFTACVSPLNEAQIEYLEALYRQLGVNATVSQIFRLGIETLIAHVDEVVKTSRGTDPVAAGHAIQLEKNTIMAAKKLLPRPKDTPQAILAASQDGQLLTFAEASAPASK